MSAVLYQGDVREVLAKLPEASVQCVVTSPPYWGLRAYGTEPQIWGGDAGCEHEWSRERYYVNGGSASSASTEAFSEAGEANAERIKKARWREDGTCGKCGAWRGELGLEPTPELYVGAHRGGVPRRSSRAPARRRAVAQSRGQLHERGSGLS